MTAWWSVNSFDHGVKCITADADDDRHALVNLVYDSGSTSFLSVDGCRPKRTEQNLIVRIGKLEAEVTNNKRLRSRYCTVKANY